MTAEVGTALRSLRESLRQQLWEHAEDSGPATGSDAALLLDALCASEGEDASLLFEVSGRDLAEQGGRLEVRLAGIRRCSTLLSEALDQLLEEEPRILAQAQRRLAVLVADAVVALTRGYQEQRARGEREYAEWARRGMDRLRALQAVNAVANSAMDLDQTLATAAKAVAREMNADLCTIFLFDIAAHELQLRATNGPVPRAGRHYTLAMGEGYTGRVADHGQWLLVEDALADPRYAGEAGAYPTPYRGLLAMPIIFFNIEKLQGVISVQAEAPRRFTDDEISFLEIVAGIIAMSIENGRIFHQTDEELRRKIHEMGTLHRVSALVTSTLELDNVLEMIVSQAVLLSGADRCVLFAVDPLTQRLRAVASQGFEDAALAQESLPIGKCCAGRVVHTGGLSNEVDCLRTDEGCFLYGRPELQDDQHSVLCAPLATMHGRLGALCVFSSQRHKLSMHQAQLVMTFANVAAIAMENARLFEQTREGLHTKEHLLREMRHRVGNNLQQLSSFLNMERRRVKSTEAEQIITETVGRIQSIAAIHDLLTNNVLIQARVDEIPRKIVGIVQGNLVPRQLRLKTQIAPLPGVLEGDPAMTFALVLYELISNAIEHGFDGRERGEIRISGLRRGDTVVVRVADDGAGLPDGFALQGSAGLGLTLVQGLVQSGLHGTIEIFGATGNPDLEADPAAEVEPAATAAEKTDGGKPRRWTVAELVFPALLPA
jgi:two-component sensor histidine kinase